MKKIFIGILVVVLLAVAGGYLFLRTGLPDYSKDVVVRGLKDSVTIERNRFAMPTVTAKSLPDLFFAWGYVNAQDRLFQMEFTRRVGQGRISEFAGKSALTKDIFLRAAGFQERAKNAVILMDPEIKTLYQRYVDGVNFYQETYGANLYMKLLGLKPEKWEIADSILIGMMLNWSLAYNMKHEIMYHRITARIGSERAGELMNYIPPATPTVIDDRIAAGFSEGGLARLTDELGWLLGCRSASNNWAVAPKKTTHGGAILCTDMQVHQSKMPNDFYIIRVKAGDFDVTGAQVAGLPFIASGYNRNMAWGLTNQGADMVDLFRETIDWEKKSCRVEGKEIPLTEKTVEIGVKGEKPVRKTLYSCGRRPVLSDVFKKDLGFDVSLDWTGFDAMDIQGFFSLNRAKNYDEFTAAVKGIRMSPQNLVYADDKGNIAFRVIGSLPKRKAGTGSLITDASTRSANWEGNIPDEWYPSLKNPDRGFIATANNKNAQFLPFDLNGTYAPGYRYENIAAMLRDKNGIDVDYCKKMQTDTHSALAGKVQDMIRKYVKLDGGSPVEKQALETVLAWDGNSRKESAGASIYNTFYVRFAMNTFADELGEELAAEYIAERYVSMETFFRLMEARSAFFDDVSTPAKEAVADIATRAFRESCRMLEKEFGTADASKWAWGKIHKIQFDHVLGKSALFRPLVNYGPIPFEGDGETNNRARFNEVKPPYIADLASAPRIIVRFDPAPKGYMMLITGECEHFLSSHDTDMIDAWLAHDYFSVEDEPVKYRQILKTGL